MLTQRQYDCLIYLHERIRETGIPPSMTEIANHFDLKSKSGVFRLLAALEQRGFIRRISKCARAIEIIRLPANMQDHIRPAQTRKAVAGRYKQSTPMVPTNNGWMVLVPLMGSIG